MATLKAVFKLFDGYSSTIDKVSRKTDEATNKILKASGSTDKFNNSLRSTGASAGSASNSLSKFVSVAALVAGALKGMSIADEFTNTSSRLSLINDGLQTQAELQDKIFQSANRSRGAYTDMASAVAKLGLVAKDTFKTNDETIAFTELIQKSFKVGGANSTEQSSAMLQLAQAMGSGALKGDEFNSISENAPLILEAVARYTGKARGELKELAADGAITADIIKNSIFAMSDEINGQFESMPTTFADVGNRIKNEALKAFQPIIEASSRLINSEAFNNIVTGIIIGINLLSKGIGGLFDFIIESWDIIGPFIIATAIVAVISLTGYLWGMVAPILAQAAAWAIANAPLIMMIAAVVIIIRALGDMGVTVEDVFGFIGGVIGVTIAGIWNLFLDLFEFVLTIINYLSNKFATFANFFANVFKNPISSVIYLFQGMADGVLGILEKIASAMDFVFGSKMADSVASWRTGLKDMADAAVAKYAPNEKYEKVMNSLDLSASDFGLERMNYSDSWDKGKFVGKNAYGSLSDTIGGLTDSMSGIGTGTGYDMSQFGTSNSPLTVEGKGKNKKVDVDMSDEDMTYLRDLAERDYINKFSTATLAPNINIQFGDIHENADANKVVGQIKRILQEEIALTAEGAY